VTFLRLEEWLPIYRRICEDFGFSEEEDLESAKALADVIGGRSERTLAVLRETFPKSVLICGGSPRLQEEISSIGLDRYVVVADSAASVILDADVKADIIVTDLDGVIEDQAELNRQGATVLVHAHGDNRSAIGKYLHLFPGPIVGTCQCVPPKGLVNFGGFTDGDRAACICAELGARKLYLAGFDFENPAEKPGRKSEIKKRKLAWAKNIMQLLSDDGVRILDATTEREMF
jgi:uncharacterized Rossmann fold enzyme